MLKFHEPPKYCLRNHYNQYLPTALFLTFIFGGIGTVMITAMLAKGGYDSIATILGFLIPSILFAVIYSYNWYRDFSDRKKVRDRNRYINSSVEQPHEIIDEFLLWEDGDRVRTNGYVGFFCGVLDDHSVVLEVDYEIYRVKSPPKKYRDGSEVVSKPKYLELPARYFEYHGYRNYDLRDRKREMKAREIEAGLERSSYSEFLDEFKKAYNQEKTKSITISEINSKNKQSEVNKKVHA